MVRNKMCDQIFFLLKGKIIFSYEYHVNNVLEEGTFVLFLSRYNYKIIAEEDSSVIIVSMRDETNFYSHFLLEILQNLTNNIVPENPAYPYPLKINETIFNFLDNLVKTISGGMSSKYFYGLKQKELLHYLWTYYSKKDLAIFCAPILNNDIQFAKKIYEKYESAKSIEELAALLNYSVSGFKKRFVKVFGIPPYNWMRKEKAKKIYYDINHTQKTLKEISNESGFSSMAHFNKFCKTMFGMSPSMLRRNI